MQQAAEIKIAYDGQALREHTMDVRDLAPALLSLGQLFDEANRVLNGDKTSVTLQIKANEQGSFEILLNLHQAFGEHVLQFLSGDFVTSVINLKELVLLGGGLLWLIKKLKGGKPSSIQDLRNGFVKIEYQEEAFEVPLKLLRLYQDVAVRKSVRDVLAPLHKDGISTFLVKEKRKTIETIRKDEVLFFALPEIQDEELLSVEREAAYSIVSLAFKDDNKWRLYDGSATINVKISDQEFLRKVDQNLVSFSKGDILLCRVRTTQWQTEEGLKTEHEVLHVKQHKPAARQLMLFDSDNLSEP